jgi:hypothetical protein
LYRLALTELGVAPERCTRDLLNNPLAEQSIGDTWADTTTSHGRLMLTLGCAVRSSRHGLLWSRNGR